jgi:hypothetical protein
MVYLGAWGKLFHEKNLKAKISWHCHFKAVNPIKDYRRLVLYASAFLLPLQKDCTFVYLDIIGIFLLTFSLFISFSCKLQLLKKLKIDRKLTGEKLESRSRTICFAYTQFDEDTES